MQDKREFSRFDKQYTIMFCIKDAPHKSYDMSRLMDISKGGLKFFSYDYFPVGTTFIFHIRFPFLYPQILDIEGQVVAVKEVLQGKTYKIGVNFINQTPQAMGALSKMQEINSKNK